MERSDLQELLTKGKEDGSKLYSAADSLHKLTVKVIITFEVLGLIAGLATMQNAGFVVGVVVFVLVSVLCVLLYAFATAINNTSKMLAHILFANLAAIEYKDSDSPVKVRSDNRLLSTNAEASQEVTEGIKKTQAEAGYEFVGEERTGKGICLPVRGQSVSFFNSCRLR